MKGESPDTLACGEFLPAPSVERFRSQRTMQTAQLRTCGIKPCDGSLDVFGGQGRQTMLEGHRKAKTKARKVPTGGLFQVLLGLRRVNSWSYALTDS
jgi:hypothetical protein